MHLPYSWRDFLSTPLRAAVLVDISSAIIAHAWFRKNEPEDVSSCLIQLAAFAVAPSLMAAVTLPNSSPWINGPLHMTLFIFFLLCSIITYRLSPFHPLARYPGPAICKISMFWVTWLSYKGTLHLYYSGLHKKYGTIVRVGPNELSIIEADLIPDILGPQGMPKGPLWDGRNWLSHKMRNILRSVIGIRDLNIHAQLRKPWTRSFGQNAIKDYEESLVSTGIELVEHLNELCRNSENGYGHADIVKYISRWSFDCMGDMAFGESFGLLRTADKDGIIRQMKVSNRIPAITQMIPWASHFIRCIPIINKTFGSFSQFALQQAQKRVSKVTEKRDLFYHLAANMNIDDDAPPLPTIISNVVLAIVAGSDTTSNVLSGIIYYLLLYPDYTQRLRHELNVAFPNPASEHAIELDKLANLELLNAIIYEALRLQPPVFTGLQRAPAKNSGGKLVGNMFIPEGTAVRIPPYIIHRDVRYFHPKPEVFWPERCFEQNEKGQNIMTSRLAFLAFSYGPANCVGKAFALSELRYITAMLTYHFEFWFEDGYDPNQWTRELSDQFILDIGKLPVKIKRRSGTG